MTGWLLVITALIMLDAGSCPTRFRVRRGGRRRFWGSFSRCALTFRSERNAEVTTSLPLTELQTALASAALLIAPLAGAGLALINTGLGRSRNAAHAMISALCAASTAALVYFVVGRCWHASAAEPARILILGGKPWNWLGKGAPFFAGLPAKGSPAFLNAWIGLIGAALVALIPIGAGGERWRLSRSALRLHCSLASRFRCSRTGARAGAGYRNWGPTTDWAPVSWMRAERG